MSTEENKKIMTGFVENILNGKRFDEIRNHVAPGAVDHVVPPGMPENVESTVAFFKMFGAAFPDFKYTLQDTIAEGDHVVQRVTCTGTMKGEMMGMKPSGKSATWNEIHIVKMGGGKIVEHWGTVDQMAMMVQLGFAQAPGA
jgi:predicted ester cyclase